MNRGLYIAFEGGEHVGKSTHAAWLAGQLDAVVTREPGGTPFGAQIRKMILDSPTPLEFKTEALLMAADRIQHQVEVIEPALRAGRHVVTDRSVYSTVAYQGFGRQLGLNFVMQLNRLTAPLRPDICILLRAHPRVITERSVMLGQRDRFEQAGLAFHERVEQGFEWVEDNAYGVVVVDTSGHETETRHMIERAVYNHLEWLAWKELNDVSVRR
jgi:dTMP kinase